MLNHAAKGLRGLKLGPMAERFEQWLEDPSNLDKSHEELVCALVDAQVQTLANRRVQSVMRRAGLPPGISIADVRTGAARGLPAQVLSNLSTCAWVGQGQNLIITGPARVGKTYLMAALAQEAAAQNHAVSPWRTPELLDAYAVEKSLGTSNNFMRRLERTGVLALDDFATEQITGEQSHWLRRLIDARNRQRRATVVASPNAIEDWDGYFGDQTAAEAIFGRLMDCWLHIDLKPVRTTGAQRNRAKI